MLERFILFYNGFESRPVFETVEEMLKWTDLYGLTQRTLEEELVDAGLNSRTISELVTVSCLAFSVIFLVFYLITARFSLFSLLFFLMNSCDLIRNHLNRRLILSVINVCNHWRNFFSYWAYFFEVYFLMKWKDMTILIEMSSCQKQLFLMILA